MSTKTKTRTVACTDQTGRVIGHWHHPPATQTEYGEAAARGLVYELERSRIVSGPAVAALCTIFEYASSAGAYVDACTRRRPPEERAAALRNTRRHLSESIDALANTLAKGAKRAALKRMFRRKVAQLFREAPKLPVRLRPHPKYVPTKKGK